MGPYLQSFLPFAQKRLGFNKPPTIFFDSDKENSQKVLGKTGYYDPDAHEIAVFIDNRHPKDILRSLAHELVHHTQNCRGDMGKSLTGETELGYAQKNPHMREMEREAYEQGNLCFRDWEDSVKLQIDETNYLNIKGIDHKMKITKSQLKQIIREELGDPEGEAEAERIRKARTAWQRDFVSVEEVDAIAELMANDPEFKMIRRYAEKFKIESQRGTAPQDVLERILPEYISGHYISGVIIKAREQLPADETVIEKPQSPAASAADMERWQSDYRNESKQDTKMKIMNNGLEKRIRTIVREKLEEVLAKRNTTTNEEQLETEGELQEDCGCLDGPEHEEELEETAAKRLGNEDRDDGRDRMHADRMHEEVEEVDESDESLDEWYGQELYEKLVGKWTK
tara:strand:- start:5171 stop:6364 length:1194 start_codon:yes stop_codon:yes gene_type:complete